MSEISKNLIYLRKKHGLSQDQLAEQLHVSRQTVSSWETGRTSPDPDTLALLSKVFGVPLEELFYGSSGSPSNQRILRMVSFLSLILSVICVLLMGFYAYTRMRAYQYASSLQALQGQDVFREILERSMRLQNLGNTACSIALWLIPVALLVILCALFFSGVQFRQTTLWLYTTLTLGVTAIVILPFWLISGHAAINFYFEWFMLACRLFIVFLLFVVGKPLLNRLKR